MSGWIDRPGILDSAAVLGEEIRCRLLAVLEQAELTVGECCQVLQLPQSTVSRHLKVLLTAAWLVQRADGRRNLYRLSDTEGAAAKLWRLFASELEGVASFREDHRRLEAVLRERRLSSARFFSTAASDWDLVRDELFGSALDHLTLLATLDPDAVVADLGCGTGRLSAALAPFVSTVLAVDGSSEMLEAARRRSDGLGRVELIHTELEELPIQSASVDLAFCVLALHHAAQPERILAEARRILRPGGLMIILDMVPHEREAWRVEMGHQWLGFEPSELSDRLRSTGFEAVLTRILPADPTATGPSLFVARAQRPASTEELERPETTHRAATRRQEAR